MRKQRGNYAIDLENLGYETDEESFTDFCFVVLVAQTMNDIFQMGDLRRGSENVYRFRETLLRKLAQHCNEQAERQQLHAEQFQAERANRQAEPANLYRELDRDRDRGDEGEAEIKTRRKVSN
jgi:hypothetical protein